MIKFHNYIYISQVLHNPVGSHDPILPIQWAKRLSSKSFCKLTRDEWALMFSEYHYSICYKSGKTLNNADAHSWLPCYSLEHQLPSSFGVISDLSLKHLHQWYQHQWVHQQGSHFVTIAEIYLVWMADKPPNKYLFNTSPLLHQEEWAEERCMLWGSRVIVPSPGWKEVLQELHETNQGISRMKTLSRCYIWWQHGFRNSGLSAVECCTLCQESRPTPPVTAWDITLWVWPEKPWSRLYRDYAGPYCGYMYLVVVDAHSKWMDIVIMLNITTGKTLEKLRIIFATHGIPK